MVDNPLLVPIARLLHQYPDGLSEYALMKQLEFDGLELDADPDVTADLLLFRKHFLVMNALYRLEPVLYEQGYEISISALHIQLHPLENRSTSAQQVPAKPHPLRSYYLDWSEFEKSSNAYVRRLLDAFWRRYCGDNRIDEACQVLGLEPGAAPEAIRRAYRRLAARHHPDRGGDAEQFRRVREAYELLMA
ncbi:DnaJ domain-containing protein [Marinobacterium sp. D7]|uniref:DNA-J related domain-containing protein n=1 Tax=Marinobacterium ramblicola TaxID=2849041 RepID=UPI001C2D329E|nr:DNA-J related domain-containing protein [Marinobacterium ramblicola]MBV1788430.1 DnaJ domain-containing protein [Marinobacterium ramblicola]